jgi:hypothetical protein
MLCFGLFFGAAISPSSGAIEAFTLSAVLVLELHILGEAIANLRRNVLWLTMIRVFDISDSVEPQAQLAGVFEFIPEQDRVGLLESAERRAHARFDGPEANIDPELELMHSIRTLQTAVAECPPDDETANQGRRFLGFIPRDIMQRFVSMRTISDWERKEF